MKADQSVNSVRFGHLLWMGIALVFSCMATSCDSIGGSGGTVKYEKKRIPIPDEVMEWFKKDENKDFFRFAEIGDLPNDLVWENGADLPEIGSPKAKKGGTFYYWMGDFPRTLRFVGPEANGAFRSFMLDYNALALTNPHPNDPTKHYPELAREWAIGPDKKTVYFRLNPDATYSDGVPIRADDYLFLFYWMRSEWITDPWYNDHYSKNFSRITKYDDLTISISLPKAKPDLLYRTGGSLRPLPMHFYSEFADDYLDYYQWHMEPTTGAYEVLRENMVKGRSVTLSKVKNWWAADLKNLRYRFNPERIKISVVRDPTKAWELFRKGELDLFRLNLPEFWHQKLPDSNELVKNGYIEKSVFYNEIPRPTWAIRINSEKIPDRNIRIGIQYACNWDLVLKKVFKGDFVRMNTVADGYGPTSHPTIKAREFSVEKAEEYFAKAGYKKRGKDGILVNDQGKRLSYKITTGYKRFDSVLTVLQQEGRKAGIDFQLEMLELTAGWKMADEKKHEMVLTARNVSVELYPRFWESFHGDNARDKDGQVKTSTNNETQTNSDDLDAMIDEYREADSLDQITGLSHRMIEWLHEDASYIPGWVMPWFRVGNWRWVDWPDDFNVKTARDWRQFSLFWIDEEKKKETLEAMKAGRKLKPEGKVYDQFKRN